MSRGETVQCWGVGEGRYIGGDMDVGRMGKGFLARTSWHDAVSRVFILDLVIGLLWELGYKDCRNIPG